MRARIISARPATADEVWDATRIAGMQERQLATVRAIASNWRNSVSVSGALVFSATLITAPEVLRTVDLQAKFDGGWLLGLGALLTALSLALSMLASFGWPRPVDISSSISLRAWERRACESARRQLTASMILAAGAFLMFAAAIAVLIFSVPLPFKFPGWQ